MVFETFNPSYSDVIMYLPDIKVMFSMAIPSEFVLRL